MDERIKNCIDNLYALFDLKAHDRVIEQELQRLRALEKEKFYKK